MNFNVRLQPAALEDLDAVWQFAARYAPESAGKWLDRFRDAIQTLENNPERCPLATENGRTRRTLREFLFGRRPNVYRVIYTIEKETVWILRIRRAQRRPLTREELSEE